MHPREGSESPLVGSQSIRRSRRSRRRPCLGRCCSGVTFSVSTSFNVKLRLCPRCLSPRGSRSDPWVQGANHCRRNRQEMPGTSNFIYGSLDEMHFRMVGLSRIPYAPFSYFLTERIMLSRLPSPRLLQRERWTPSTSSRCFDSMPHGRKVNPMRLFAPRTSDFFKQMSTPPALVRFT